MEWISLRFHGRFNGIYIYYLYLLNLWSNIFQPSFLQTNESRKHVEQVIARTAMKNESGWLNPVVWTWEMKIVVRCCIVFCVLNLRSELNYRSIGILGGDRYWTRNILVEITHRREQWRVFLGRAASFTRIIRVICVPLAQNAFEDCLRKRSSAIAALLF